MKIIKNKYLCTGCTACVFSCPIDAITMIPERDGFFYPEIDAQGCIRCRKCQEVCPINHIPEMTDKTEYYAAININEDIRWNSSSGGVFSLLAKHTINKGGLVYGAAYDLDQKVIHVRVSTMEEIPKLQGAKYSQSYLEDTYRKIEKDLKDNKSVLFSGTPCQVAGLKAFLGKEYKNLLLVDLVCHGVPSPKVWEHYIDYRRRQDGQLEPASIINLRSKESGWSRYRYSVFFDYKNGYQYKKKNCEDSYMISFVNDMTIRPSCNECHFKGIHRCSDITLGDFWGIWDINPGMDDDKGTSLVLVHSDNGRNVWNIIKDQCIYTEVTEEESYRQNPSVVQSSRRNPMRDRLLDKLDTDSFDIIEREVDKIRNDRNGDTFKVRKIAKKLFGLKRTRL